MPMRDEGQLAQYEVADLGFDENPSFPYFFATSILSAIFVLEYNDNMEVKRRYHSE